MVLTPVFRIILIIVAVLTTVTMLIRIRRAKLSIGYALFWLGFAALIIIMAVFPELPLEIGRLIGIQTGANFVLLLIIFLLIFEIFQLTVKLSGVETKLNEFIETQSAERGPSVSGTDGREEKSEKDNSSD